MEVTKDQEPQYVLLGGEHQEPSLALLSPTRKIMIVAAIAVGIQFGWALQLSLLTPYVQLLGIPHKFASFIWLCGPVSGMVVQPLVGYYSDNCSSRFGRRRPFIVGGATLVCVAVILIGFAVDIGHASGDPLGKAAKPRAIAVFVFGFWILDVANNMLQGPCRAFLADISGGDNSKMRTSNAMFSFFMAVGNILGFAAGSYTHLYKMLPFTKTIACDVYCANLKTCFIISITILSLITILASTLVKENITPSQQNLENTTNKRVEVQFFINEIFYAIKDLPKHMWFLLLATFLNNLAWTSFLMFDTDWMGREVYGGEVGEGEMYDRGVRMGALGLMIQSIVLGIVSLGIELMSRGLDAVKKLWVGVNFLLVICLGSTVVISNFAKSTRRYTITSEGNTIPFPPEDGVKVGALVLFAILGIPLAVTYSVPFALASIFSRNSKAGQGLTIGVLNLSIVTAQFIISILSGPWDDLFGGGNLPAFIVGAIFAAASAIVALTLFPSSPPHIQSNSPTTSDGFH